MGGAGLKSEEARGTKPRRRRGWRLAGWAALGLLLAAALAVLLVPLVWPVPPLRNTVPARELADADSRFVEVDGIEFHYKQAGPDSAPCTIVLLHGFGASSFSWRDTLPSLGGECRVIAFDRPGFGLTGRPLPGDRTGANPYSPEAHADQTVGLMDALGVEQAVLVGHSAGAAVAAQVAARHPARVSALALEAPAIYGDGGVPGWLGPLLRTPQARRVGPLFVRRLAGAQSDDFIRSAFADPSKVTAAVLEGYRLPLRAENWDRALWEFTAAPRSTDVAGLLPKLRVPALVISGGRDTFVPPTDSRRVADALPGAATFVLPDAGHIPHEESPEAFNRALRAFVREVSAVEPAKQ